MKINSFLALCTLLVSSSSCYHQECKNVNPIFDNYAPDSKIYMDELAFRLKEIDNSELSYWFEKYEEEEGNDHLFFLVQGKNLCAIMKLTVNEWDNFENLRRTKGKSYQGAKFLNLKYSILQDSLITDFVYISHDRIVD